MTTEYKMAATNYPNEMMRHMIYLKNTVKAFNVHIGEFTYYDSHDSSEDFEKNNILYNYPGHGELYIGKFCSIASGVQIIMGAANHSIKSFSTYPFSLISENWASKLGMIKEDMPDKGDTIIGNDVWIGREAKIMPGVMIGDGAIIGSYCVVAKDVPAYSIVVGNPAKVIKNRFDNNTIQFLEEIQWWDFESEYLEQAIPFITSVELASAKTALRRIKDLDFKQKVS